MPVQPNFLERMAFYSLNVAPSPMLDLVGAIAFQALNIAVQLDIFITLAKRPFSPQELANELNLHERGTQRLLEALVVIGYVVERNGRYHNSAITEKWFLDDTVMDMTAAMTAFSAFFRDLFPLGAEIIKEGKRPFDFYEYTASIPDLSDAHQRMMQGNANLVGSDIVKKVSLPETAVRLLDVGGGHGQYTIHFCQKYPQLTATILDDDIALNSARQNIEAAQISDRVDLYAADLWQVDWGTEWDIVLLFNLLHHYDLETNQKLLAKAHAALKPGGQVMIFDQVAGKLFGSATTAIIKLVGLMYYLFADGRTFTRDELTTLLSNTNFKNIKFHPLRQAPGSSLLVAER